MGKYLLLPVRILNTYEIAAETINFNQINTVTHFPRPTQDESLDLGTRLLEHLKVLWAWRKNIKGADNRKLDGSETALLREQKARERVSTFFYFSSQWSEFRIVEIVHALERFKSQVEWWNVNGAGNVYAILDGAFRSGDHEKLNALRNEEAQLALDTLQEVPNLIWLPSCAWS
ncbi:hypothetical protein NLI96_g5190 [Meripilus lineatus]|uniref:Uncharacterized protein n=1 Tax=Meripilus lineatus TaxID=2056292 RepID=A0AAD5V5J7_9APHY|nr:hypothetical protein NLI96_g5190 [Physisporinus lineatus]